MLTMVFAVGEKLYTQNPKTALKRLGNWNGTFKLFYTHN